MGLGGTRACEATTIHSEDTHGTGADVERGGHRVTRWKRDLDDQDREVLAHLMGIAKVLEDECPQTVLDWNAGITTPTEKPKRKRRKR